MGSRARSLSQGAEQADKSFRPEPPAQAVKGCRNPSWVDFRLQAPDGKPVAGRPFKLTLPDGSVRQGTTDADGRAGTDGIDPGRCTIEFLPPPKAKP